MEKLRKILKEYYVRQIVACWMMFAMLLSLTPVRLAMAATPVCTDPGGAAVLQDATSTNVTVNQAETIMQWSNFNTVTGESVNFGQGSLSNSAVLNKISGGQTNYNGILNGEAGMRIFLINPAGIIFGETSVINVTQLTASALNITDDDFLNGAPYEFIGGDGAVINQGSINAESVALIGRMVQNMGTIITPSGGCVAMVAGDRVLLGEPGGKIVVEVDAVASADIISVPGIGDVTAGDVINTEAGVIDSPDGQIVLAAGDLFSVPLHPQLMVNSGTEESPVYEVDDQPMRVEIGIGTVEQLGTIQADGTEGSVVLTAGDEVVLDDGSLTTSVGGEVTTYAYDFSNKAATTYFNDGATIQVGDGLADISGNHIFLNGYIDALPDATIQVDPVTLTIADGAIPPGGAALDTLYEAWIESYSNAGVNLDLAADDMITVEYMTDGEIYGGSGDILLRNVFDNGGIYFEEVGGLRTAIHTTAFYDSPTNYRDGGNIYMIAGAGGIVAGDLTADALSQDHYSEPGKIRLLTTNGGDIEVGAMSVSEGGYTEISAIASGNLTVNGDAVSYNATVPKEDETVGQARICLIAGEDYDEEDEGWEPKDIVFNGELIEVKAHGKVETTADIRISATGNVTIGSAENEATISAEAKTSESKDAIQATAYTVIHAGRTNPVSGVIIINGETYTSGSGYLGNGDIIAKAWPGPLSIDTDGTPTSSSGTKSVWEETGTPAEDFYVRIEINNEEAVPLSSIDSPCHDCPRPEGLPPVPAIFWIVDDEFSTNWRSGNIIGFDPAELDVLLNDNGIKFDAEIVVGSLTTAKGGTLELVLFDPGPDEYYGFKYTPPTDQPFEWDGVSEYASFTDTFEYQATKEVDGETIYSKNTATVTITVNNILPVLSDGSQEIHMNTDADFDLATVFELPSVPLENTVYIVDEDGTPGSSPGTYGTLTYGIMEGQIPVADGSIATDSGLIPDTLTMSGDTITYSPLDGYVSPPDSPYEPTTFGYTVVDSSIVDAEENPVEQSGDLAVTVTNELPTGDSWLGTTEMDTVITDRALVVDGFADVPDGGEIDTVSVKSDTYSGTDYLSNGGIYGGQLEYDGDYTYTPDTDLPGYVGDDQDNFMDGGYDVDVNPDEKFTVQLWDGQRTYYADGSSEVLSTDYGTGTVSVDIVHEPVTGDAWYGQVHMDQSDSKNDLDIGFGAGITVDPTTNSSGEDYLSGGGIYGGQLVYDGTDYTYTPDTDLPGYVGDGVDDFTDGGYDVDVNPDEKFAVKINDGERIYYKDVDGFLTGASDEVFNGTGTISVDLTNTLPTAGGDLGPTAQDTVLIVPQTGTTSPVLVSDLEPDSLSIITGTYFPGSAGGTLEFSSGVWTYTPASGHIGGEEFNINVWDGQYDYTSIGQESFTRAAHYGSGVVTASVTELPPPPPPPPPPIAAPLPKWEIPRVEGCPVLTQAAAVELGIAEETLQVGLGNALALNPNIQPCQACESLLNSLSILKDVDGSRMAAMIQVFNAMAPADAPYTPEMATSIAMAFGNAAEGSQYASAMEFVDAFVQYASALDAMGSPVGDSTAFVMGKYGQELTENMANFIAGCIASGETF